jgi:hypothetical protein|tara:strand:+ start:727 stop:1518 length:792 start_codon:yes stop_codon:yes gene_type:complete
MKKSTQINPVERLKNDKDYYGSYGKEWLSNSDIKTLLSDPAQFGAEQPDNENFAKGRYVHQAILEPHKIKDFPVVDVKVRGKEYKEYLEKNDLTYALKKSEAEELKQIGDWFLSEDNPKTKEMRAILNDFETSTEVPAIGNIEGMPFKGKADIVSSSAVFDIKTTNDIHNFYRVARIYGYDSQAYIYQTLFGKPLEFWVIGKTQKQYVKSKNKYYDIGIFKVDESFVESGKIKVQEAIKVYNNFIVDNAPMDLEQLIYNVTLK